MAAQGLSEWKCDIWLKNRNVQPVPACVCVCVFNGPDYEMVLN